MNKQRTAKEITTEIDNLETLFNNPKFQRFSAFGDDHFKTIRIQIAVLENDWDEDDIDEHYQAAYDTLYDTLAWKRGEDVDEAPYESWKILIRS